MKLKDIVNIWIGGPLHGKITTTYAELKCQLYEKREVYDYLSDKVDTLSGMSDGAVILACMSLELDAKFKKELLAHVEKALTHNPDRVPF